MAAIDGRVFMAAAELMTLRNKSKQLYAFSIGLLPTCTQGKLLFKSQAVTVSDHLIKKKIFINGLFKKKH